MILEAFSQRLHTEYDRLTRPAEVVLQSWLTEILRTPPPAPEPTGTYHVAKVLHAEIALITVNGTVHFQGRSKTGERLLQSLEDYCKSYEQWQFSRWLHQVRASDFPPPPASS